ncbi:HNH endonuclease signature motif containing protein [Stenotrophomonas maltophilia]|uniref:HNH endonuclease signature motif containing protein n=1 Tax=Stenotrophomonas maltophilia TaxID=40324 RepID=UPI0039F6DB0F
MPVRPPKHRPHGRAGAAFAPPARNRQADRALPTNSTPWLRLRAKVLAASPLCVSCQALGRIKPATHVDHVDGDSRNNELANLQGLCAQCHNAKTAREDGGFGNRRRKPVVPQTERKLTKI